MDRMDPAQDLRRPCVKAECMTGEGLERDPMTGDEREPDSLEVRAAVRR
ncbi:hypothetical protein [Steroidobacter denitrificans]|nr:hypothetical protein [Steroidobacter denitrificans]